MKHYFLIILITFQFSGQAQIPQSFEISYAKDAPLLLGGLGSFVAGYVLLNQVDGLSSSEIQDLNPDNLNFLDKSAVDNYSDSDDIFSDVLVATIAVAPVTALLDQNIRNDFLKILVMGSEVVLINNGLNLMTKALVKRTRPYAYNENVALENKLKTDTRYSFYSAHTSNAASISFFTASIVSSYSNDKTLKTIVWTGAVVLPLATGYLRYSSGSHFPTDVITGCLIGASIGYFIPLIHQKKKDDFQSFELETNGVGFTMRYNF
jgi:membrane-associated phospholipid phosphatase